MKRSALVFLACALFATFPMSATATPDDGPSLPTVGGGEIVVGQIIAYVHDVQVREVGDYLAATAQAEQAQLAVYVAAMTPPPSPPVERSSAPTSNSGVGECTGFAIPDYIIQRESGGNAYIQNPTSDAFGCAQTLLSHYSGGSCSGLDPYTLDGQRQCVNILSNGGTNLAPWALKR